MPTETKLLIAGDFMPTSDNEQEMIDGKYADLMGDTLDVFKAADFRFCNVEGVFTERGVAINKAGPNLGAKPAAARILRDIGIDLVSLANNHSLDWGKEGLTDTFTTLRELNIPFTGAGYNADEARKPYRITLGGHKISFITVAEHEFTIARKDRSGANPFDPFDTIEDIEAEKRDGYIVIVIYHGGKENYRYTSPNTRRRCRKMAEHGADFIFCQHTHCVCCYEDYRGCHICYGQGNTLFARMTSPETWQTLLLPMITIDESGRKSVEYFPVCQSNARISLAKGEAADAIMKPFCERSAEILDDAVLEEKWQEFFIKDGMGRLKAMGMLDSEGNEPTPNRLTVVSNYITAEIHYESVTSMVEYLRRERYGKLAVDGEE